MAIHLATASEGASRAEPAQLDRELIARLRQRGHRVTAQRLFIHRALRQRALRCADSHVSAEQVFEEVSQSLPSISLPTVYATLDLFEELGLVRRVCVGQGAVLFDVNTAPHAHTVCRRCGRVSDLERPRLAASQAAHGEPHQARAEDPTAAEQIESTARAAQGAARAVQGVAGAVETTAAASERAATAWAEVERIEMQRAAGARFQPEHAQLLIWGLCASCRSAGQPRSPRASIASETIATSGSSSSMPQRVHSAS